MKQTIKYLNDNRRKCLLGVINFEQDNVKVVEPSEIVTFDLEVEEDEYIFFKTWKHDDKVLISVGKK